MSGDSEARSTSGVQEGALSHRSWFAAVASHTCWGEGGEEALRSSARVAAMLVVLLMSERYTKHLSLCTPYTMMVRSLKSTNQHIGIRQPVQIH